MNTRIVQKRLHVRIEHAKHSKCRQEFLDRVKRNEAIKKDVKAKKGIALLSTASTLDGGDTAAQCRPTARDGGGSRARSAAKRFSAMRLVVGGRGGEQPCSVARDVCASASVGGR